MRERKRKRKRKREKEVTMRKKDRKRQARDNTQAVQHVHSHMDSGKTVERSATGDGSSHA